MCYGSGCRFEMASGECRGGYVVCPCDYDDYEEKIQDECDKICDMVANGDISLSAGKLKLRRLTR